MPSPARALLRAGASEYRKGRPKEALEALLEACDRLEDPDARIDALLLTGRTERDLGLIDAASRHFGEALELARRNGNQGAEVDVLNLQSGLLSLQGDPLGALDHLEQGLDVARAAGLAECQAHMLNNVGSLRTQLGDHARARDDLTAAAELIRRSGEKARSEAVNLINLGHLSRDVGDTTAARGYYARAREVGRKLDDQMVEVVSLNSLANVLGRSGEWETARELYHEALVLARRLGFRKFEVDNLDGLGQAHHALGEYERSTGAHREALAIARAISDPEGEIDALIQLGRNGLAVERPGEAIRFLIEAYERAHDLERTHSLVEVHELLGQAYEQKNDLARALGHQREVRALEKVVLNETFEQRSKHLSMQYETERTRRDAESYRLATVQQAREEAEARVATRTRELEQAQMEIVSRLASAAEHRDDETGEHTRRVGSCSAAIAQALGWAEEEVDVISWSARLHDVGKLGVRDAILLKPGKLTGDEFALVRAHTVIGASILSGGRSRLLRMAEEIALSHHERWDGNGYPMGLAADAIPMSARIVAVADAFDALAHDRPYKRAWSTEEALKEIRSQSGRQFDPAVVEAFLDIVREDGEWAQPAAPRHAGSGGDEDTTTYSYNCFAKVLAARTRNAATPSSPAVQLLHADSSNAASC